MSWLFFGGQSLAVSSFAAEQAGKVSKAEGIDFFKNKIEPVLIAQCYDCHSAISEKAKGGLRLDSRVNVAKGGKSGFAVVPGDVKKSLLIEALHYGEFEMPPSDPLPQEVIADFEKWVAMGAPDPRDHAPSSEEAEKLVWQLVSKERLRWWSLLAVRSVKVPQVKNKRWAVKPVDRFIFSDLEKNKLAPSARADRRNLARRLSIILVGMVPSPEEVERLVADQSSDELAVAAYVDRLLASPRFGETWAQHWLDGIRFGESNGSEDNLYRSRSWWYRDYVARAFNQNMPYAQFVREQLAGDVLGVDEATGFLVAGPHVSPATIGREASAILQARYDRLDELMQTVGASLLGSSLGCARCHDHKFDAISTKDYYSIVAVFQDVEYGHRMPKLAPGHPKMQRYRQLLAEVKKIRGQLKASGLNAWSEDWGDHSKVHLPENKAKFVRVKFFTGFAKVDEVEIYGPNSAEVNLALSANGSKATDFNAKHSRSNNGAKQLIDGEREAFWGWSGGRINAKKEQGFVIELAEVANIDRIDLSTNRAALTNTDYLEENNKPGFSRYQVEVSLDGENWKTVFSAGAQSAKNKVGGKKGEPGDKRLNKLNELTLKMYHEGPQPIFAGKFIPPVATRVLQRGDPNNKGDAVVPNALSAFRSDLKLSDQSTGAERRLAFADWLVDGKNPLTARVAVNRIWYHVFGSGIVSTLDDFGQAGEKPSHPELLDYLAKQFVDSQWDMKAMIRRLLLSQTFAQASLPRAEALKVDAGNRLLWRFAPRRVGAEVLRDSILLAAGTLDQRVGGKGYRIHADKKRYAQWKVVDNSSPQTWRRLFYQQRMRGVDDRMFMAFDLPDCKTLSSKRPVSTTPIQALNLMNGKLVEIQAGEISQRVKRGLGAAKADVGKQVEHLFLLVLSRKPQPDEKSAAQHVVEQDGLAALARVLFNTNEFAFLD
ncbi:MAG: DUF1553 domain-containing protein [Verrucomicrobiota bacterium]